MALNDVKEMTSSEKRKMRDAEDAKSKMKGKLIIAAVIACAILCVVLTVLEGNGIYRKTAACKVNDTEYSVAEYNWMYTNSFAELYNSISQTYGNYASYIVDPQKPLKDQQYSEDQTWADYVKEYTDQKLLNMTVLYDEATKAGWTLSEDYTKMIDSDIEGIKSTASQYNTDVASYLTATYGRGVNEKVYRSMYEKYYYAYSYANSVRDGIEITSADIDAKYNEDKKAYDTVSFKYIFVDGTAAESEDAKDVLQKAKDTAEAIKASENMDEYVEKELGSAVTALRCQKYAAISATYADWLFDETRKAGDREIFDGTNGYYVVEFTEANNIHYNTVDARHILVSPEDTSSEASWQEALEKATKYLGEIKEKGGKEDDFSLYAMLYSEDTGSKNVGGLYEGIYKGQMVEEFENWCFDDSRKAGDMDIVKTSFGYHIMYFVGEGEDYYTSTIDADIRDEKLTEIVNGYTEGYEITDLAGMKKAAKHL